MRTLAKYRLQGTYRIVLLEIKPVRGLRLRISGGMPVMSAPPQTTPEECRRFLDENEQWIQAVLKRLQNREQDRPKLSRELIDEYVKKFPAIFEAWQDKMGLYAKNVTFKIMSSRWGSCSYRSRRISINLMLAKYPEECTDYVIVHELAHLVHPNHSADFWNLVQTYFPDWRRVRAILRN